MVGRFLQHHNLVLLLSMVLLFLVFWVHWILSFWKCCVVGDCWLLHPYPMKSGEMFWLLLATS